MTDPAHDSKPFLRVIHGGEPTPEELAALVAALTARAEADADNAQASRSRWASRSDALRQPLRPGPGAWARSARNGSW